MHESAELGKICGHAIAVEFCSNPDHGVCILQFSKYSNCHFQMFVLFPDTTALPYVACSDFLSIFFSSTGLK